MRRVLLATMVALAVSMVASPALAGVPKDPKWKSSHPNGGWSDAGYVINNNAWNGSAGPQTVWADSFHHWGAVSRQASQASKTKVVQTYPEVQKNYGDVPIRLFRIIRTGFSESMPRNKSGVAAEAANDVWLSNHTIEVMIWVENHGERPMGRVIGHATIFGQRFAVWHGGSTFTFALDHNETRGLTHILACIKWLIGHRFVLADVTLTQVNFGWEIASTGGRPRDFTIRSLWMHTKQVHRAGQPAVLRGGEPAKPGGARLPGH